MKIKSLMSVVLGGAIVLGAIRAMPGAKVRVLRWLIGVLLGDGCFGGSHPIGPEFDPREPRS